MLRLCPQYPKAHDSSQATSEAATPMSEESVLIRMSMTTEEAAKVKWGEKGQVSYSLVMAIKGNMYPRTGVVMKAVYESVRTMKLFEEALRSRS